MTDYMVDEILYQAAIVSENIMLPLAVCDPDVDPNRSIPPFQQRTSVNPRSEDCS